MENSILIFSLSHKKKITRNNFSKRNFPTEDFFKKNIQENA